MTGLLGCGQNLGAAAPGRLSKEGLTSVCDTIFETKLVSRGQGCDCPKTEISLG